MNEPTFLTETIPARDGTRLGWERTGTGPGLLLLPGGGLSGKRYRALAAALSGRFTVFALDRRGRGHSGPARAGHSLDTEMADLEDILRATSAGLVFGHSAGALFALEAALRLPIRRLAVYDPPVPGDVAIPLDWLPEFEAALENDRPARAMVLMAKGLQMGIPAWVPAWLADLPARFFMRGERARETAEGLRALPREVSIMRDRRAAPFAEIRCPTLLLLGAENPDFVRRAAFVLRDTIPGARFREMAGLSHVSPNMEAPEAVAQALIAFFTEEEVRSAPVSRGAGDKAAPPVSRRSPPPGASPDRP